MNKLKQRAENAMVGLAIGDALSWTSMFHRSFLLPPWTRRIRREIDSSSETTNVIVTPMPFSLNQPANHFNISPTDKTEWAAFTAENLLKKNFDLYEQEVLNEWMKLANSQNPIRGGVSTQAALNNLRKGIQPPQSGKQNPHYFDDGAMSRAVPIGIMYAGQPDKAAEIATIDATVTNSEDGVWAAQAIAVTVSLLCAGENIKDAINGAYQYLPELSWIRRTVDEAMEIAKNNNSIFSILPEIHNKIVNREYSYGNVAPETLALTFIIVRLHGDNFETAVTTAASFAKSGETLPAMVGALAGAMQLKSIASEQWLNAINTLKGICIPNFAGKNYLKLIEAFSNKAGKKILV
jgi:ADP-ribosylglycohydrolase